MFHKIILEEEAGHTTIRTIYITALKDEAKYHILR